MECQHQQIAEKLVPYLEGALADADSQEVQLHLQECQLCSQEVRALSGVVSSLRARVGRTLHFVPTVGLSPDDVLDYALDSGGLSETTRRRIQLQLVESLDLQQEVEWLRELESDLGSPETIPVPAFPPALSRALDEAYSSKTRQPRFKLNFLKGFHPRTLAAGLAGLLLSGLAAHSLLGKPGPGALATTAAVSSPASRRDDLALDSRQASKNGNQPMLAIAETEKAAIDVKQKNNRPESSVSKESKTESFEKPKVDDKRVGWGNQNDTASQAESVPTRTNGSVSYYLNGTAQANPPSQQASTQLRQSTLASGGRANAEPNEKSAPPAKSGPSESKIAASHQGSPPIQEREVNQDRDAQVALAEDNGRARTAGDERFGDTNKPASNQVKTAQPLASKFPAQRPEPVKADAVPQPAEVENDSSPVSNAQSAQSDRAPELPMRVAARNQEPASPRLDEPERRQVPVRPESSQKESAAFRDKESDQPASSGVKALPGLGGREALPASKSSGVVDAEGSPTRSSNSKTANAGMIGARSSKDPGDPALLKQAQKIVADMQLAAEFKFERRGDNSLIVTVKPQIALDQLTTERLRQSLRNRLELSDNDSIIIRQP